VCADATGQQNDATVINEDVVLKEATGGEISVSAPANDDAQAPAPEVADKAAEDRAAENNIGGQAEEDPAESEDSADQQANASRINIFDTEDEEEIQKTWLEKIVTGGPFEMTFGLLIVLNTLSMCVEAEYRGWGTGNALGLPEFSATNASTDKVMEVIELFFGIVFTVELVAKIIALKGKFRHSRWNVFDFTIISIAWIDFFLEVDFFLNPMLLRLVRLVRLLRLLRGLSAFEIFDNLHLMVRGIKAATPVLIWVVVLVFPALACCALGMNYLLVEFMQDTGNELSEREQCFKYFGTFTKAMLSMFEVTFGNWVPVARFLVNAVDAKFAMFFMTYQLVMGIAVLRIIYGVFLHVTFACATSDDETLIAKKKRENKKFAEKMHALFSKFDAEGDGYLSREEFREIAKNPLVKTWLSAMDLEMTDTDLVFDLADGGDNKMNAKEMVFGFSRLKGTARSIDIWALISLVRRCVHEIEKLSNTETKELRELKKIDNILTHQPQLVANLQRPVPQKGDQKSV
jgi:hypothetical protein